MAQLDHTIFFRQQAPDLLGSAMSGLDARAKLDERAKQKKLSEAYQAGVIKNPDGSTSFDQGKTISALAGVDPQAAMKMEADSRALQQQKKELDWKDQDRKMTEIAQTLGGVKDQQTLSLARQYLQKNGHDVSDVPEFYDQSTAPKLSFMAGKALSIKDRIAQQNSDRDYGLKEREVKAKELEARNKKAEGVGRQSEGQKALDKDFAKDYNDWTSGGSKIALSEIKKLSDVAKSLKSGDITTGGLTGIMPDRLTSDKVLKARADVQSTVMNSLKAILGAQFTEKEGDRIIKNTWNEADTTANNMARVERLVQDLSSQAIEKSKKAKYFEQSSGSLHGYQSRPAQNMDSGIKVVGGVTYRKVPGGWEEAD